MKMKRAFLARCSALAIVALWAGQAVAQQTVPLHAASGAFQGEATVGAGLRTPTAPDCISVDPVAVLCGDPGSTSWTFDVVTGTAIHYEPDTETETDPGPFVSGGGALSGSVIGTTVTAGAVPIGPYCGASGGAGGVGSITLIQPAATTIPAGPPSLTLGVADVSWAQSAATIIVYSGRVTSETQRGITRATEGTIAGVVSAIPIGGEGSCLDPASGATVFTIVGTAEAEWE